MPDPRLASGSDVRLLSEDTEVAAPTRSGRSCKDVQFFFLLTGLCLIVGTVGAVLFARGAGTQQATATDMAAALRGGTLARRHYAPSRQFLQPTRNWLPLQLKAAGRSQQPIAAVTTDEAASDIAEQITAQAAPPKAPETTPEPPKPVRQVEITLTTPMMSGGLVKFAFGRSMKNTKLIVVETVAEGGDAWERGLRPGMVVKALTGTNGNERTEMWEVDDKVSLMYFKETIRLARYPIDFVLLENVQMGMTPQQIAAAREAAERAQEEGIEDGGAAASLETKVDKRIAMRKAYNAIDDERNDFPLLGGLAFFLLVPPVLILALNSVYHFDQMGATPRY